MKTKFGTLPLVANTIPSILIYPLTLRNPIETHAQPIELRAYLIRPAIAYENEESDYSVNIDRKTLDSYFSLSLSQKLISLILTCTYLFIPQCMKSHPPNTLYPVRPRTKCIAKVLLVEQE